MSGQLGELVVSLSADIARFSEDMGKASRLTNDTAKKMSDSMERSSTAVKNAMTDMAKAATAAFAAFQVASAVKETALLAARVETLGVVMTAVGNNAGYSGAQMESLAKGVAAMGITTQESRNSLIKMAGSQMDLTKASALARVAQDAAVIGNVNSSEAFGRMIQGVRSGELEILKNIGINIQFEEGYKKTAAQLGKNTTELTAAEKMTSRMNEVLAYGANIAGVYESSMSTAGKQLSSMSRYTEELKLGMGEAFRPALVVMIQEVNRGLKAMNSNMSAGKEGVASFGQNLANSVSTGIHAAQKDLSRLSELINEVKSGLYLLGAIGISPTALVGAPMAGQMVATSNAYAQAAQSVRDYREALKAVQDSGGPDASDVKNLKMAQSAMEDKKIRLGEELRIQREAIEKKAALQKEQEAEAKNAEEQARQRYNSGVVAYNKYIDDLLKGDLNLDAHSKKVAEIKARIAEDMKLYPEHAKDIENVGARYLAQAEAAKTLAFELANLKEANAELMDSIKGMATDLAPMGKSLQPAGGMMNWKPAKSKFSLTGAPSSGFDQTAGSYTAPEKAKAQYDEIMAAGNPYKEQILQLDNWKKEEEKKVAGWDDKALGAAQRKADALLAIDQNYADAKKKIEAASTQAAADSLMSSMGQISNMLMQGSKKQFEDGKQMAKMMIAIDTAKAASAAFAGAAAAGGPWGVAMGVAAGIAAMGVGTMNMARLDSVQYEARAAGGPVNAGQTYLVGEKGPELFTAGASGQITNNDNLSKLGGSPVSVTQVYQISTGVVDTVRAEIGRLAPVLAQMSVQAVKNAMRGGEFQRG